MPQYPPWKQRYIVFTILNWLILGTMVCGCGSRNCSNALREVTRPAVGEWSFRMQVHLLIRPAWKGWNRRRKSILIPLLSHSRICLEIFLRFCSSIRSGDVVYWVSGDFFFSWAQYNLRGTRFIFVCFFLSKIVLSLDLIRSDISRSTQFQLRSERILLTK